MTRVRGNCPMGCGPTLFLGTSGYVTCSFLPCPRPDAVSAILREDEHDHIVDLTDDGFVIHHPLRERLDDEQARCDLQNQLDQFRFMVAFEPGRYRFRIDIGTKQWIANALDAKAATDGQ